MIKSIFNFKILYKDGSIIDLNDDKNLWVSSFRIHSPGPEHVTETIEGSHGSVYLGTTLKERKITVKIAVEGIDYVDFDLFRDEIFRIFNPLEKFYIIRDLQPGKRMEVSITSDFDIDYVSLEDGEFQIDFVIHSVFLESIGTTQDSLTFDIEKWQIGQGLLIEDLIYTFSSMAFRIYNAGDVIVDSRQQPLKISFTGSSNALKIKNITTGDEWQYTGTTSASDSIILEGVKAKKNDSSIFKDTNFQVITIKPGWNDFDIVGATGIFSISFDFRFYYL